MKLNNLHTTVKKVSATNLFKGEVGTATAIRLKKDGVLKEHITKTPALLLCVVGSTTYQDETKKVIELGPGDFVSIVPNVKHWLEAQVESHLVLLK